MKAEECICCNIDKNNKDEGTGLNNMLCDILYHSSSENCYVNIPFQILYLMPNKINRNERLQ